MAIIENAHLLCNITRTSMLEQQHLKLLKVISNMPPENQKPNRLPRNLMTILTAVTRNKFSQI